MTEPSLHHALTDVRKAYRLLWAFQKRVIAYNRIIRDRLGFEHNDAGSRFAKPNGADPELCYTWDFLPMVQYRFVSKRVQAEKWWETPKAGDAILYVRLRADTGLPMQSKNEPDALTFPSVESCRTLLQIAIILNQRDRDANIKFNDMTGQCALLDEARNEFRPGFPVDGVDVFHTHLDMTELGDEMALLGQVDDFATQAAKALGTIFAPHR